jgi:hypothetical protein
MPTGHKATVDSIRGLLLDGFQLGGPKGDCYVWKYGLGPTGYGRTSLNGKKVNIHRLSYGFWREEIPEGMFVCHTCDNRACYRPSHLFVGSAKDNAQDAVSKKRLNRSPSRMKLTDQDVELIRASQDTHQTLAERFGVSKSHVRHIRHNRNRSHV